MRSVSSLAMTTSRGHRSVWHFVECTDGFYAFGGCHRPLVKRFDSVDQLRALYRSYLGYGYQPLSSEVQLELALA